jgi:hypothetical protein
MSDVPCRDFFLFFFHKDREISRTLRVSEVKFVSFSVIHSTFRFRLYVYVNSHYSSVVTVGRRRAIVNRALVHKVIDPAPALS